MFRFPCAVRASATALTTLTTTPAAPITSTPTASMGCGLASRRTASTTMATAPDEEQHSVGLRREHFGPLETVRMPLGGGSLRERQCSQRQSEREHVGGQVHRVGVERQGCRRESHPTSSTTRNVAFAPKAIRRDRRRARNEVSMSCNLGGPARIPAHPAIQPLGAGGLAAEQLLDVARASSPRWAASRRG